MATAAAFERYVGIAKPVTFGPATADGGLREVKVGFGTMEGGGPVPDPKPTMSVFLRDVDASGNAAWMVVRADAPDIMVDRPSAGQRISSPAQLTGMALAFEGNVNVEVREDGMVAGQFLGEGHVTGGGGPAAPFSGTIAFTKPSKPAGAVVCFERSAAEGQGVLRPTVVRVAF
ncbi:MAG: Immunoglobulin-like domain of bacterial spore germination [Actinomycetota bacterium]|nr:Immunoglobulin-like domain of bacterial spore germination [Actinomycetota bacterium]